LVSITDKFKKGLLNALHSGVWSDYSYPCIIQDNTCVYMLVGSQYAVTCSENTCNVVVIFTPTWEFRCDKLDLSGLTLDFKERIYVIPNQENRVNINTVLVLKNLIPSRLLEKIMSVLLNIANPATLYIFKAIYVYSDGEIAGSKATTLTDTSLTINLVAPKSGALLRVDFYNSQNAKLFSIPVNTNVKSGDVIKEVVKI